jgi:DNA-binding NarL/FixJ family response regulator
MDVLSRIREKQPGLPVLILTGEDDAELVRRASEIGIAGYMVKPPDLEAIETLIAGVTG